MLKPVYTAASEAAALDRFAEFSGKWEQRYPAFIRLWENAGAGFVPLLRFNREIRTVICTSADRLMRAQPQAYSDNGRNRTKRINSLKVYGCARRSG